MPDRIKRVRFVSAATLHLVCAAMLSANSAWAQSGRGDGIALGVIFAEQHVEEAALHLRQRTALMTGDERYRCLSDWVLPGAGHVTFRLGLAYVPTDPSPPVRDRYALDELSDAIAAGGSLIPTGGYPVSPALDLIDAAAEAGKLDDLRSRLERAAVEGEMQLRCRLALLLLTDIARQDFEAAVSELDELSAHVRGGAFPDYVERWPETLAVWTGIRHPETREPARDLLFVMLQDQVRSGYANGPDCWDRAVSSLAGRVSFLEHYAENNSGGRFTAAPPLNNWSPVSRTTALTRGYGFPCTHWSDLPGGVEKLAGHNEDYLMYRIPLRGNFEVECDVSMLGWRDCHLSVAGVWVAPLIDRSGYAIGEFRSARPSVTLNSLLAEISDWIRYRVVVRDGVCTTYLNGRPVHEEPLPAEHDPWLAIRSPWYANSVVRGLRITGEPEIPEQVRLSLLPDLKGWTTYYDERVGGDRDWRQSDELPGGGIVGRRRADLAGAHHESLLRYQRPLLEDGTLEYEFYYRDGEYQVHPALDRRAFVLAPDGVRIHWITDGVYDQTDLDPANIVDEPACRRGPDRLPLKSAAWNRLRLALVDDTVDLFLNDEHIYHCVLEPTNQRTFGLFHYSDRGEARARNVVWTGDWPRRLPPVAEQELADRGVDFLDDRLDKLEAVFEHDFARDGFSNGLFSADGYEWEKLITVTPDGLRVTAPSRRKYVPAWIAPRLRVDGDFDIVATFDRLSTMVSDGGSSGISLQTILDDAAEQRSVYRGYVRVFTPEGRQLIQTVVQQRGADGPKMTFHDMISEESTAGRLRLARRGETVYCLFAEGDSAQFRLVTQWPFAADRLRPDGVRLQAATQGESGAATVVWKSLTIRAEGITRLPPKSAP